MSSEQTPEKKGFRPLAFLPAVLFMALAGLFLFQLYFGDAKKLPSALIGKPSPTFALTSVPGMGAGLSSADLRQGKLTILNVFASWCVPCHQEHPVLMELAQDKALAAKGVVLMGLAYKDEPENTRRFLGQKGNPFARIGADSAGRAAIEWGVYGVPETFLIKGDGTIAYKFVGPLSADSLRETLLPEIEKALK